MKWHDENTDLATLVQEQAGNQKVKQEKKSTKSEFGKQFCSEVYIITQKAFIQFG
jgi:hypothetical protein